jgi:hypothetical protein
LAERGTRDARRHPRIDLPKGMWVAWKGGGRQDVSRVSSLSVGGVFILERQPLAAGTIVQLLFDLPGGEVRARGTVCNVQVSKGMGVRFSGMRPDEHSRLANLMERMLR